ncbi:MAG: hypothetical protein AB4057_11875 [Crocosphaera sp.]
MITKAIFLIDKEGADILSAFLKYKAKELLNFGDLIKYLRTDCHWESQSKSQKRKAQAKCTKKLSNFVEKSLINYYQTRY